MEVSPRSRTSATTPTKPPVTNLPSNSQLSKKAGDVLLRAGVIKPEQYEAALQYMGRTNDRFEEAILDLYLSAIGGL